MFIEVQRYHPHDKFDEPEVITTFTPKKTSLVHSFSLTEEYAVLFLYPLDVNPMVSFDLLKLGNWSIHNLLCLYVFSSNRRLVSEKLDFTMLPTNETFSLYYYWMVSLITQSIFTQMINKNFFQSIFSSNFHLMEALEWNDMEDTDVYVIGLKDGNIRHLTTQPMYSLHHANAYQLNKVSFKFKTFSQTLHKTNVYNRKFIELELLYDIFQFL